jgi:chromosomal replication initiation ATPase DnaA
MFTGPAHFYEAAEAKRKRIPPTRFHDEPKLLSELKPRRDIIAIATKPKRDILHIKSEYIYTLKQVFDATMRAFQLSVCEMTGPNRAHAYTRTRHASWYLSRKYTKASSSRMGAMWKRDHSSILAGIEAVERNPDAYRERIEAIEAELKKGGQG